MPLRGLFTRRAHVFGIQSVYFRTSVKDALTRFERETPQPALYTMAGVRCPRCGSPDFRTCACPPTPPDTLGIAVQRNQERDQRQAAAFEAEHPVLAAHWRRLV